MVWKCLSSKKKHTKTSSQFNSTIELMDDPIATTRFSIMCYKFFSSKKFLLFQSWFTFFLLSSSCVNGNWFAFWHLFNSWRHLCWQAAVIACNQETTKTKFCYTDFSNTKKKLRNSVFNRYTFIDFILLFFNNLTVSVVVLKFFNYWKTSIINGFWYKITDRNVYSLRRCLLYIHIIYQ